MNKQKYILRLLREKGKLTKLLLDEVFQYISFNFVVSFIKAYFAYSLVT